MARWQEAPLAEDAAQGAPASPAPPATSSGASPRWMQAPLEGDYKPSPVAPPAPGLLSKIGDAFRDLYQSEKDSEQGMAQKTRPLLVREAPKNLQGLINPDAGKVEYGYTAPNGEFAPRKLLGELQSYDFGDAYKDEKGELRLVNPKTDVVLREPGSNRQLVFERTPDSDYSAAAIGAKKLLEGFAAGPVAGVTRANRLLQDGAPVAGDAVRAVDQALTNTNVNRLLQPGAKEVAATEKLGDLEAFNRLGVTPFAPALGSKGTARVARTIEELPSFVGQTVKGPKTETLRELGDAQQRIAQGLGAPVDDVAAGQILQRGLDRFRTAGIRDLEPDTLAGLGIAPRQPIQPTQIMSAGARRDAVAAAPIREALGGGAAQTSRGAAVPAARSLDQTIIARRGADDLSDAELQRVIRAPSGQTSFAARQEALYENAYRQIPAAFREDGSRNPGLFATTNSGQVAAGLLRNENAAEISGGILEGRFGQLVDALRNPQRNFTLGALRSARTEIGRALSSFGQYDARLDRSQLRALYGAVSRDIEIGLETLANRSYLATRNGNNASNYVSPDIARAADRALYEFRRADRYTRLGMDRMDRFLKVVGAESPEAAVRVLGRYMRENTANVGAVRAARQALQPDEWNAVMGHIIANLGRGRAGAQEAEAVFNPVHFATDWNRLNQSERSREALFGALPPQTRQALDDFARAVERMKYYETTRNYSGTAYSGIPAVTAISTIAAGNILGILTGIAQVGGTTALGKFLTSPRYMRMIAHGIERSLQNAQRARQELSSPNVTSDGTRAALLNNLIRAAANDNELGPVLRAVAGEGGISERNREKKKQE